MSPTREAQLARADAAVQAGSGVALPVGALAAVVLGTTRALEPEDWWLPGLRERAGAVLRGVDVDTLGDGLDGALVRRVVPPSTAPALRALYAVGLALASPDACAVVHLGPGSVADGAFTEALNLASLRAARVVFVVAWRDLSAAPVPAQSAATPEALATVYGVRTLSVDGADVDAVAEAVQAARSADGPTVVVAHLDR